MRIKVLNAQGFENAVREAVVQRMRSIFDTKAKFFLKEQAEILQQKFLSSEEFTALGGRLVGEFGFTPEEVNNLQRISSLLVPGSNDITVSKVKVAKGEYSMLLEWVDLAKLKEHEFAQHVLTRLDASGRVIGITDIVSWVEWLEEGATVRGYYFSRPGGRFSGPAGEQVAAANFSRSGEGLMKKSQAGSWIFRPTRVFERIGKQTSKQDFKRGFGLLVRSLNE